MMVVTNQIDYRRATLEDVYSIVEMHKAYIAGEDLSIFQDLYLDYYYQEIIHSENCVFVALAGNKVIGFCSLVADHSRILMEIVKHKYYDIFKVPLSRWFQVLKYSFGRLYYEAFRGKWNNSTIREYQFCIELRAIAVNPGYRRVHVGTNLLQTCIETARRSDKMPIVAWVLDSNDASIRLFLSKGFRKVGIRKMTSGNFYLLVRDV